jgi:hypothetical protein
VSQFSDKFSQLSEKWHVVVVGGGGAQTQRSHDLLIKAHQFCAETRRWESDASSQVADEPKGQSSPVFLWSLSNHD